MKSQKQIFLLLLPMAGLFESFAKKGEGRLEAHQVQILADIQPDMSVLSSGALPQRLNTGCPSCIRESFNVASSWFGRASRNPDINDEFDPESDEVKIPAAPERIPGSFKIGEQVFVVHRSSVVSIMFAVHEFIEALPKEEQDALYKELQAMAEPSEDIDIDDDDDEFDPADLIKATDEIKDEPKADEVKDDGEQSGMTGGDITGGEHDEVIEEAKVDETPGAEEYEGTKQEEETPDVIPQTAPEPIYTEAATAKVEEVKAPAKPAPKPAAKAKATAKPKGK